MTEPKVELKKIKTFRGNEGYGMNAEIYINGVKSAFVIDDANGGCFNYEIVQTPQAKTNFKLLEDYIKTLPKIKTNFGELVMDMDLFISEILNKKEKEKFEAKKQKLFETAIVFGVLNGDIYRSFKLRQPVFKYDAVMLQGIVDDVKRKWFEDDDIILNTNLEALGIKI